MLAAMRRASSRVSSLAAARRPGPEIDVGERLPFAIAHDEALLLQLGVGILDGPGRREALTFRHGGRCSTVRLLPRPLVRRRWPYLALDAPVTILQASATTPSARGRRACLT
jgi:hypothetical protein